MISVQTRGLMKQNRSIESAAGVLVHGHVGHSQNGASLPQQCTRTLDSFVFIQLSKTIHEPLLSVSTRNSRNSEHCPAPHTMTVHSHRRIWIWIRGPAVDVQRALETFRRTGPLYSTTKSL